MEDILGKYKWSKMAFETKSALYGLKTVYCGKIYIT